MGTLRRPQWSDGGSVAGSARACRGSGTLDAQSTHWMWFVILANLTATGKPTENVVTNLIKKICDIVIQQSSKAISKGAKWHQR